MKQKQNKHTALYAMKTPTNNVNKPWALLQTTEDKEKLFIIVMRKYYVIFPDQYIVLYSHTKNLEFYLFRGGNGW